MNLVLLAAKTGQPVSPLALLCYLSLVPVLWAIILIILSREWNRIASCFNQPISLPQEEYWVGLARGRSLFNSCKNVVKVGFTPEGVTFRMLASFNIFTRSFLVPWSAIVIPPNTMNIAGIIQIDAPRSLGSINAYSFCVNSAKGTLAIALYKKGASAFKQAYETHVGPLPVD